MNEERFLLCPFWWQESPSVLRRDGECVPLYRGDRELLELWCKPASPEELMRKTGRLEVEIITAAERLEGAGVLVREQRVAYPGPEIELEISSVCNSDCTACPRDVLAAGRGFFHMSAEVLTRVLENVTGRGVTAYYLCGIGEPMLHPEWYSFAEAIRLRDPSTRLVLYSNGTVLSRDSVAQLLDSAVDEVIISIHESDVVPGGGTEGDAVPEALRRLDLLLDQRQRSSSVPDLGIGQILGDASARPDPRITTWAASRGVRFEAGPIWNRAGHVSEQVLGYQRQPAVFRNRSPQWCRHYACVAFIDHRGNLLPCCCDMANEATEMSAVENPWEVITGYRLSRLAAGEALSSICSRCDAPCTNRPFLETAYYRRASATDTSAFL